MKIRSRCAAAAAPCVLLAFAGSTRAGVVTVEPAGATVAGQTVGEWTADWWRWAASVVGPGHPFTDTTGVEATRNQSGPVYFLAGTQGGPAVNRSFSGPADKYVLVPLINWVVFNGPDAGFADTKTEATALADHTINPALLTAEVDGVPVSNLAAHREASPTNFTITPTAGNPFYPAGTFTDGNADGYWLMLDPLGAGPHTLHYGGTTVTYDTGTFTIDSFTVDVTAHVNATSVPLPPAVWPGLGALGLLAWRATVCRNRVNA